MCHCAALASNVPTVTMNVPQRRQQHFLRNADAEMTIFKKRLDKRLKLATLPCVFRRSTQLLEQKHVLGLVGLPPCDTCSTARSLFGGPPLMLSAESPFGNVDVDVPAVCIFGKHFQHITGIAGVLKEHSAATRDRRARQQSQGKRGHRSHKRSLTGDGDYSDDLEPLESDRMLNVDLPDQWCPYQCGAQIADCCRREPQRCMGFPRFHKPIPTFGVSRSAHLCFSCWLTLGPRDSDPALRSESDDDVERDQHGKGPGRGRYIARSDLPMKFVARGSTHAPSGSSRRGA